MSISDEEFAKQLWEHDWEVIDGSETISWDAIDEWQQHLYRETVSYVRDSSWLEDIINEAYHEGKNREWEGF